MQTTVTVPDAVREAINRVFAAELEVPRYRYWRCGTHTYEYTTVRCRGEHGEPEGFWAVDRAWSKGGRVGTIKRSMRFRQRAKAKARAFAWYEKAEQQRKARAHAKETSWPS